MRNINLSKQAEKFLSKFFVSNKKQAIVIVTEIQNLSLNPLPQKSKKLKGYRYYRVRVGNYRIIYHFNEETIFITIINKRDIIYKNLTIK